jgi:hypothetical protein
MGNDGQGIAGGDRETMRPGGRGIAPAAQP